MPFHRIPRVKRQPRGFQIIGTPADPAAFPDVDLPQPHLRPRPSGGKRQSFGGKGGILRIACGGGYRIRRVSSSY